MLQHLPQKLHSPYKEKKVRKNRKLTRKERNDPVRKIIETNNSV